MKGEELRAIRNRFGLTKHDFALQLGYRGNVMNNSKLIKAYEQGRKQIPLTVASLAWLIDQWSRLNDIVNAPWQAPSPELPEWPAWSGYDDQLGPPIDYDRGARPAPTKESIPE